MTVPLIGERYRGVEGHSGFLLVQAWHALRAAMDTALRPHDLTPFQYGALSVLARDPGLSGADLARACNLTPGHATSASSLGRASPRRTRSACAVASSHVISATPPTTTTSYSVFPVTAVSRPGRGGCSG
jgi:hypothetical protein